MRYLRLFNDADGSTRFEDVELQFMDQAFAPPAPPLGVSHPVEASSFLMLHMPQGWEDPAHPAPARQFMVLLSGEVELTAGHEVRHLTAGAVVLAEDTRPPGHGTRVTQEAHVAVTRL